MPPSGLVTMHVPTERSCKMHSMRWVWTPHWPQKKGQSCFQREILRAETMETCRRGL